MVEGPIPWRDTVEYAERAGLTPINQRTFCEVMRAMDEAYLKHRASQRPHAKDAAHG